MNYETLKNKLLSINKIDHGQWIVKFLIHSHVVSIYTTDSIYIDAIKSGEKCCGYTPKQALTALYKQAKYILYGHY